MELKDFDLYGWNGIVNENRKYSLIFRNEFS